MTDSLPRVELGTWPTPLEPAPRLSAALGLRRDDLWVKRDDLGGLGGGGNKLRKLELLAGEAVAHDADTLVTTGAPQSNHARLTAATAARLGMRAVLVFPGTAEDAAGASGNLVLDGLFGATVAWGGAFDVPRLAAHAEEICARLRAEGRRPWLIPYGGTSPLGAQGYVACGRELLAQAPDVRTVVTAVGSGGTYAGLAAALGTDRVLGVHTGAVADPLATVTGLLEAMSAPTDGVRLRLDQVGAGYGSVTDAVMDALALVARTEGIVLDPIYTGRAMAGLVAAVRDGEVAPGERVVLVHTGGLPGLFGYPAAADRARAGLTSL